MRFPWSRPRPTEAEQAAARWARINAENKAAGCRCGGPSEVVRYYGPSAQWSCREHVGVNVWHRGPGEHWIPVEPSAEEAAALAKWQTSAPRPYTQVDAIRGGTR